MATQRSSLLSTAQRIYSRETRLLQCRSRSYSATVTTPQIPGLASKGAAILQSRRLIELRGPQASQFLQGLTTANIPSNTPVAAKAIYSAFLNAQGRLLQDVFIYHLPPGSSLISPSSGKWALEDEQRFLIEVDTDQLDNLTRWLKKYKLRAKVAIREVPLGEVSVFSTWDDSISLEETIKSTLDIANEHSIILPDVRAPNFGLRMLSRGGSLPASLEGLPMFATLDDHTEQQYRLRRYAFGVPEGQTDLAYETALVHDSNIDYMGGVDFRKGCYVGQELVIRTQHTGVVRKRILPCVLYSTKEAKPESIEYHGNITEPVSAGTDIKSLAEEGKRARSKGKWLAGVGNLGLALCRLEDMVGIGPAGDAIEGWESKDWIIEQSSSSGENDLKVKAFVPSWWQERSQKLKLGEHGTAA